MKKVISALAITLALGLGVHAQNASSYWLANSNATGAEQNPLSLGNWSNPTSVAQYQFFTSDLGSQPLTIHSTRYSGGLIVRRGSPTGNVNLAAISGWHGWGTNLVIFNVSGGDAIRFTSTGDDNFINTGNLAIGTNNAQGYKLAVNGSAIFTSAKVKLFANWPDYVFDYSYNLRPLSEVEKYIRQHHHLPEVPSADDVKENGLDLGANQAILLKKIEELTLYVIELKKENEEIKKDLQKTKN
jgi:hypothetical protein